MRKGYAVSGVYADSLNGNGYVRTPPVKRKRAAAPVTVLKPTTVTVKGLGAEVEVLKPVTVIKSPRKARMDKEDRRYLGY